MKRRRAKNKHRPIDEGERALFLDAVEGELEPGENAKGAGLAPISNETSDEELFLSTFEKGFKEGVDQFFLEKKITADQSIAKKAKKRPAKEYDAQLDLHGLRRDLAAKRVEAFVTRCFALGKRKVLIIHGIGSGALRQEVHRLLELDERIGEIRQPSQKLGGRGAVIAQLRSPK